MVKGMMMKGTKRRLSCPKCGWSNVRSSEVVSVLDWAAKFAGFSPLRCRSCRLRFYRPFNAASKPARIALDPRYTSPTAEIPTEEANPVALGQQGRVLLLDDDRGSRKLLRRLLDREGYAVREVPGVTAALAELRNTGIDLAIVNLNGHEGKVVVRSLRNAHPDLIVVVLSETPLPADKSRKLVVLPKPSDALAVLQNIRHLMSQERRPEIAHT
jgi:CheY-like chemotaxis protein